MLHKFKYNKATAVSQLAAPGQCTVNSFWTESQLSQCLGNLSELFSLHSLQ